MNITLDYSGSLDFINKDELHSLASSSLKHLNSLISGDGEGSDFLGWINLPEEALANIAGIEDTASRLRDQAGTTVVIGIGGSYLGTKAILEALKQPLGKSSHELIFAGHNISEDYLSSLLAYLENRKFNIVVISKSGTTTEPAIAFRLLKSLLEEKEGKKTASGRIIAITDSSKGALRELAVKEGYQTFTIPDDVGGRFSVLSPVGLLPLSLAGTDIGSFIKGAADMALRTRDNSDSGSNPALLYAALRNILYDQGKMIELLANFEPGLHYLGEWWKQLYGESEGKDGKGIFPASANMTTDLHSLGQYIQDGERILFETVLSVENSKTTLRLPEDEDNLDKLNYIAGLRISEVNKKAEEGTVMAHIDGGVPVIRIQIPVLDEYCLGQLIYLFEIACGISGYILGVNPFNQPGVEAYKKNMFKLLGK